MLPQELGDLEYVARPRTATLHACRLGRRTRQHVVEHDHARRGTATLDVDEIAEGELGDVESVDEGEVDGGPVEECRAFGEESSLVARTSSRSQQTGR